MVAVSVVAAFLFFILLDIAVLKFQGKAHPAFEELIPFSFSSIINFEKIAIPAGIILSRGHTWLKKVPGGLLQIGIDDFAPSILGKVSITVRASVGDSIKKGDIIFEGKAGGQILKFRAPIEGKINSFNLKSEGGEILNPFADWIITIMPKSAALSEDYFFKGKDSIKWIKEEYQRLEEFINAHSSSPDIAGVTMYDGGKLFNGAFPMIMEKHISEFENEFLVI